MKGLQTSGSRWQELKTTEPRPDPKFKKWELVCLTRFVRFGVEYETGVISDLRFKEKVYPTDSPVWEYCFEDGKQVRWIVESVLRARSEVVAAKLMGMA
jgi:hypothetical protein